MKILVVLSLPRSGTSLLVRILSDIGCITPNDPIPPHPTFNSDGFFESQELLAVRQALEKQLGVDFSYPVCWSGIDWNSELQKPDILALIERACSYFDAYGRDNEGHFAFKDPRTTVLLPFWHEVFRRINAVVTYIVCVRDPRSTIASIQKFSGLSSELAEFIWLESLSMIFFDLEETPFYFVTYERWFSNELQLRNLCINLFGRLESSTERESVSNYLRPQNIENAMSSNDSNEMHFLDEYYSSISELNFKNDKSRSLPIDTAVQLFRRSMSIFGPSIRPDIAERALDFCRREETWSNRIETLEKKLAVAELSKHEIRVNGDRRSCDQHLELGEKLLNIQDYPEATRRFVHAHAVDPHRIEPPFFLSISVYLEGDMIAALRWARISAALVPTGSRVWEPIDRVAQILIQLGRFDEADLIYRHASADMPGEAELYRRRSQLCALLGKEQLSKDLVGIADRLSEPRNLELGVHTMGSCHQSS